MSFSLARLERLAMIALLAICFCDQSSLSAESLPDVPPSLTSDAWPVERGNVHGTGVAASALPATPELLWKKDLGEAIEATAVIAEGVIYIGDVDGTFYALQLRDGSSIWSQKFEAGFLSAAGFYNHRIFVGDFDGNLHCLDARSGEVLWTFEATAEFYAGPNFLDGNVLLTSEDGSLYCLNAEDGEVKWKFSIDAPLRCMPTVSEGRIALAGCDARLHVIDATSGQEIGFLDIDGQTGSTPAAADGHVYFGTEGATFYNLATSPPKETWAFRDPRRMQPIRSAAVVTDQLVVYASRAIYALDRSTGESRWQFPLRASLESSPVASGDHLFFATGRGQLNGISLQSGEQAWQYEAGNGFSASPAVAESRLVIGNEDGTLYCFGSKN